MTAPASTVELAKSDLLTVWSFRVNPTSRIFPTRTKMEVAPTLRDSTTTPRSATDGQRPTVGMASVSSAVRHRVHGRWGERKTSGILIDVLHQPGRSPHVGVQFLAVRRPCEVVAWRSNLDGRGSVALRVSLPRNDANEPTRCELSRVQRIPSPAPNRPKDGRRHLAHLTSTAIIECFIS